MGEKFESRESEEDVADLMSSLTRELAETGGDTNLAQMVQNAKDLWLRGEHAAAYWVLEAFRKGQENVLGSASRLDKNGSISSSLTKDVSESELYQKLGTIQFEMSREVK